MKTPKQPEVNIGLVGHVDHGKTTLTKALSGEWTDRHSEEIKRGISIRLGYADTAFYKCPKCEGVEAYSTSKKCPHCGSKTEFLRAVSFVDSPGHETLMATMLTGAALMNGALLLIAANEPCPQPQTKEHLMGLEISGIKNIIIVQNKIDIVTKDELLENYRQIKEFVKGTVAENAPIIPVSAHHDVNIDVLIKYIEEVIPTPEFDSSKPPRMYIARSFDVNKPGTVSDDLKGGVLGGSLIQGELGVGDEVEIAPAFDITGGEESIVTEVVSLFAGGTERKKVRPGGLVGVGTLLDPAVTKSDSMTGKVLGKPGTLPPVWKTLSLEPHLLEKAVGTETEVKVEPLRTGEPLMLNVGTSTTVGVATSARENVVELRLKIPVCAEPGQRVAISRRIGGKWRLIGYGIING